MATAVPKLADGTTPVVQTESMRRLMQTVERLACHKAAVLITGETGSGKEMIARAVHNASLRCHQPFVDINCAALPEHLVESELFGYEKGAFSGADAVKPGLFELADKGTLFLDEIGELDSKIQVKLLRVLDGVPYYRLGGSRKVTVDVRVIAATNRSMEESVRSGRFRSDLYHRLCQARLTVPPLRERPEDIIAIAEQVLQQHVPDAYFSATALAALQRHGWPGNIRELKNVVFRAVLHATQGTREITEDDLLLDSGETFATLLRPGEPRPDEPTVASRALPADLGDMERQMILSALARNRGNQVRTAEQLGISRRTLNRKLKAYRLDDVSLAAGWDDEPAVAPPSSPLAMQRHARVNVEAPVHLVFSDGVALPATSTNVSLGGIGIRCDDADAPLPQGSTVQLHLSLPDGDPLRLTAEIVWSGAGGEAGLRFLDVPEPVLSQLQDWLLGRMRDRREAAETVS